MRRPSFDIVVEAVVLATAGRLWANKGCEQQHHTAARRTPRKKKKKKSHHRVVEVLVLLVQAKANVHKAAQGGTTPADAAARRGFHDILSVFARGATSPRTYARTHSRAMLLRAARRCACCYVPFVMPTKPPLKVQQAP